MDSPKITKSVKKYSLERIGSRKCQKIPLPIGVHLVGRSRLAHLFINSKFCNRIHCRLIVDCDSISVCVDGEKRIGGVYVNDKRHKRGKVLLHDGDMIGFGNPTNLRPKDMAYYGNKVHVYNVQCITEQQTSNNNSKWLSAKWIPSSVMRSQQSNQHAAVTPLPLRTTVSTRPPTPPKHDSEHFQNAHDEMPPVVTDASTTEPSIDSNAVGRPNAEMLTDTENQRKVNFAEFANVRLYDPEDFSYIFLDGVDDKDAGENND